MAGTRTLFEKKFWTAAGRAINHGNASSYRKHRCGCDDCWEGYINSTGRNREVEFHRAVTRMGGSR